MKVSWLLRYSVECSMVVDAETIEAAVQLAEDVPFEEWEHDHGPIDGELIINSHTKEPIVPAAIDPAPQRA